MGKGEGRGNVREQDCKSSLRLFSFSFCLFLFFFLSPASVDAVAVEVLPDLFMPPLLHTRNPLPTGKWGALVLFHLFLVPKSM